MYDHEVKERKHPKGGVSTEAPPRPTLISHEGDSPLDYYIKKRGLSPELAWSNGWYYCLHQGLRILIPAITRLENHHYWQARAIGDHPIRYASPFGPRRDALIRVCNRLIDTPTFYLCEGPMDALALAEIPQAMAYAFMGVNPSDEQLAHILAEIDCFKPQDIVLVADKDQVKGMACIQARLAMQRVKSRLKIPLDKKDIACYNVQERMEVVR